MSLASKPPGLRSQCCYQAGGAVLGLAPVPVARGDSHLARFLRANLRKVPTPAVGEDFQGLYPGRISKPLQDQRRIDAGDEGAAVVRPQESLSLAAQHLFEALSDG
jgi:hypothetical protein